MQLKATKKDFAQNNDSETLTTKTNNSEASVFPPDYQLNLSDFALFLSVMKVKEAYQDILSIILDEPDLNLKEVKVEQVILNKSGKRAIRLDAWAQDNKNRQFDMEMQNSTSQLQLFLSPKKIFSEKTLQCTPSVNGAKRFQTFHSQTVPVKFF